jgi:hypothetical protein
MGVSLVRYRNQLRLERFVKIMDGGRSSMLEAARAAGLRQLRAVSPRVPLAARDDATRVSRPSRDAPLMTSPELFPDRA